MHRLRLCWPMCLDLQAANCHRNRERAPKCIQLYLLSVCSVKQPEAKIQVQKRLSSRTNETLGETGCKILKNVAFGYHQLSNMLPCTTERYIMNIQLKQLKLSTRILMDKSEKSSFYVITPD